MPAALFEFAAMIAVSLALLWAVAASGPQVPATELPEFRVEGTSWQYAKLGDIEILARAPTARVRQVVGGLQRGRRLLPEFMTRGTNATLRLIVVDNPRGRLADLPQVREVSSNRARWDDGATVQQPGFLFFGDGATHVLALNVGEIRDQWPEISTFWVNRLMLAQQPKFPPWVTWGLFGPCAPFYDVWGVPHTTSIRLSKLSWPNAAVASGSFPPDAGELPAFAVMFDPARTVSEEMSLDERHRFEFHAALFARWSLFGPTKNGRHRNGYWAFAEMARRGQATEAVFRECYGMDWPQACVEMRAYLRTKAVGMIEVRIPQAMADVPEAERLKFRDATPEDAKRILTDFNHLRDAEQLCNGGPAN